MKTYLPHQQRVLDEHKELAERLQKLDEFINLSVKYDELEYLDQYLLKLQYIHMQDYLAVLDRRISRF